MEIAMLQSNRVAMEQAPPASRQATESAVIARPDFNRATRTPDEQKSLLSTAQMKEQVKETTDSLNEMSSLLKYGIRFAYDDKASEMLVNVIDVKTDRVIRQVPPKKILAMRAKMAEMVGLLVDREV